MPKDRRERSVSLERSRQYPFSWSSGCSRHSLPRDPLEDGENIKEWDDARCPVCIEHPHNAILLLCSSHEKGCRPFMCDTSYRHSNCFDQFQKSFADASSTSVQTPEDEPPNLISSSISEAGEVEGESSNSEESLLVTGNQSKLICPLCRGAIKGWTIVKKARSFMNNKSRSCACETCEFSGTYADLRKHARLVHPLVRPADADPERQRNWRRLERQRDFGDLVSILQNSIGGEEEANNNNSSLTMNDDGWLTTIFLLVRFIRPGEVPSRTHARLTVRTRRSARLWGEALDLESDGNETSESSLDGPMLLRSLGNRDNDNTPSGSSHRRYLRRRYYRNQEN